jgi:hypothetical protein
MVVSTYLDNQFAVDVVRLAVSLVGLQIAELSQALIEFLAFSFYLDRLHLVLRPLHTAQKSISSFCSMEITL